MADSFRDLVAWRKAMELVRNVYDATASFPERERFGLTNQIRRAAVSVPSNIAEGKGRYSKKEFMQFLATARGSLCELQTQLEIGRDLGYMTDTAFRKCDDEAREVGRIINGLIQAVRTPTRT